MKKNILLIFLLFCFQSLVYATTATKTWTSKDCLSCHNQTVKEGPYQQSAHKDINCTACHIVNVATGINKTKNGCAVDFKKTDCSRCHEKINQEYSASVHNSQRLPISCGKCHNDIHERVAGRKDKIAVAQKCVSCHSKQKDYFSSQHFAGLKANHNDAATCSDCHGLHKISKIEDDTKGRAFHTQACLKCHDDKDKMEKNKVTTISVASFYDGFHGKNVRLGYPEKVAGCADCHTAHAVNKADNKLSSVHPDNRLKTCNKCHKEATPYFAQYIVHAQDHDQIKFPHLFWTRTLMTALLVLTFGFFWLHSLLWGLRAYADKKEKKQRGLSVQVKLAHKKYRRFKTRDILLHILVVVSFLGLSLTGLPLKFSDTSWGKTIFDFLGGAERARLIHHICAIITFTYFSIAVLLSARFLFEKKIKGSFTEKLFGPDSLFPNKKDWEDLKAMFKWFFYKGPRPHFERWTYWEKFDFLAVFWGMVVIGSSGIILWFPVFFAKFLPGWIFNIATIIHSDEALLATGFIFTVHFFNTHFRPEKFPMDFVIFNGEVTKEEMLEERSEQWMRYEKEGKIHELEIQKPSSPLWNMALRIFGYTAVLIGIALAIAIITAMITN